MRFIFLALITFGFLSATAFADSKSTDCDEILWQHHGIYTNSDGKKIPVCVEKLSCVESITKTQHLDEDHSYEEPTNTISSIRKAACPVDETDHSCPSGNDCKKNTVVPSEDVTSKNIELTHKKKTHSDDDSSDSASSSTHGEH